MYVHLSLPKKSMKPLPGIEPGPSTNQVDVLTITPQRYDLFLKAQDIKSNILKNFPLHLQGLGTFKLETSLRDHYRFMTFSMSHLKIYFNAGLLVHMQNAHIRCNISN